MPARVKGVTKAEQDRVDVLIHKTMNYSASERGALRSIREDVVPLSRDYDVSIPAIAKVIRAYFGNQYFPKEVEERAVRRKRRETVRRE